MIGLFAKLWTRHAYVFKLEAEAATHDLHAALSLQRAAENRNLIVQFNQEADVIEENIKREEATPEYLGARGQGTVRGRPGEEGRGEDVHPGPVEPRHDPTYPRAMGRLLALSEDFVVGFLTKGFAHRFKIEKGLPADAKICDV
jgi:hypothetical protein